MSQMVPLPVENSGPVPLARTQAQKASLEQKKLEKVAKELEGVFIGLVLQQMRKTIPQDDLFNSQTTQFFTEMLDDEFGQIMAKGRGIGIAQSIIKAVERQQQSVEKQGH